MNFEVSVSPKTWKTAKLQSGHPIALCKMGKKSKAKRRAAGGGKKKATAASNTTVSTRPKAQSVLTSVSEGNPRAVATSSTSTTPALPSSSPSVLRGIVCTNDDPSKCALCSSPMRLEMTEYVYSNCCGKAYCYNCDDIGDFVDGSSPVVFKDLLGRIRCTFCNALTHKGKSICHSAAISGNTWAMYRHSQSLKRRVKLGLKKSPDHLRWLEEAAEQSHPEACLELAAACIDGKYGCPLDLRRAKLFAEKSTIFFTGFRLRANSLLLDIAKAHVEEGALEEALGLLTSIASETNMVGLNFPLCESIAATLTSIQEYKFAGNVLSNAFFHGLLDHGLVRSTLKTSFYYALSENFALSKLWLSIACQTKSHYALGPLVHEKSLTGGLSWSDSKDWRDSIKFKLRENRDSCGGCGAALEGDMRKYCRGCKAYCYCSRECQKLHWNRKQDSHRDECKEAEEHWKKATEAIRGGKVALSKEKE